MLKRIYLKSFSVQYKQRLTPLAMTRNTMFKNLNEYKFNTEKQKDKPINSFERLRLMEQMEQQTNLEILRREILNDSIQLPLKVLAYYYAPSMNKSTFFAELIRSCIDAFNHIILYATSRMNLSPSGRYPYGIEKVKNMVVLIPAILFLYFGMNIQYESITQIYLGLPISHDIAETPTALILYLISIGVESGIIVQNVRSAIKQENTMEQQQNKTRFQLFMSIFKGKDPVLQTILFENAITLTSTFVPIMSSVLTIFFPSPVYEIVGSMMIGAIQIKLGYQLLKKNVRKLMGEEAIDKNSMKRIEQIILDNPYVQGIVKKRAVLIGTRKFRFAAEITFDTKKITKQMYEDYDEEMERIIYAEAYSDREAYLKELIQEVPKKLLAKLHQELDKISIAIKDEFPNCIHDILEINQQSLAELYDDNEWENNLYSIHTGDQTPEIPFEKWMLEEADQLIEQFRTKDNPQLYQSMSDYIQSVEYSQVEINSDDENILLYEDFRFAELQDELNQKYS